MPTKRRIDAMLRFASCCGQECPRSAKHVPAGLAVVGLESGGTHANGGRGTRERAGRNRSEKLQVFPGRLLCPAARKTIEITAHRRQSPAACGGIVCNHGWKV